MALAAACALSVALPAVAQTQGRSIHTGVSASPEVNSAGDIPHSQVFVTYRSSPGYSIKVPEGWARSEQPGSVGFSGKYNAVQIDLSARASKPSSRCFHRLAQATLTSGS